MEDEKRIGKSFKILLANRFVKVFGTLIKGFAYIFHFLFPKKRFTIPKQSPALKHSRNDEKIPKIIWQTNFTNKVTLPVYANYLCNRFLNPDFEYRFMDHDDRDEFILKNTTKEISDAFFRLNDGAAQADLWRLVVLNTYGGVYMDIDGHSVWSLSSMLGENEYCFLLNKKHFTNYFIASSPNNKYLQKAIDLVVENISQNKTDSGIYSLTGPMVLNRAIGEDEVNYRYYKYTCIQGSFTNEYFQYMDKPRGKWIHTKRDDILKEK